MSGTLDEFGVAARPDPPRFRREAVKQSPHTGKIAGFIGRELTRGLHAYATRRSAFHYYRKGEGYAISDSILAHLDRLGVTHIFVPGTDDDDDVLEFTARQYHEAGEAVPTRDLYDEADPQTYVPEAAAQEVWAGHVGAFYAYSFEAAMERIDWRGYDPRRNQ